MAVKINLQQLAKTLAQKKKISQKDAEAFLRVFFDAVIQNVTTGGQVKIKSLGTFKLTQVLDRESVDINTGERIVIPGHTKLSFTPEASLRDTINKPFADFQTVIINEGTSLEEMERVPQSPSEEEPITQPLTEQETVQEEDVSQSLTEQETEQEETEQEEETPRPSSEQEIEEEEPEQEAEAVPEEKPVDNRVDDTVTPDGTPPAPRTPFAKILASALGVLLLCLVCFFAGRYLTHKPSTEAPEPAVPQTEAPVEEEPVEEVQYAQVPGGKYKIVGTRKTYVMKPGDFITRIAIQEYGDKDIAPYIIVHNAFPDPDNVPVDMEIKLPELEKVE